MSDKGSMFLKYDITLSKGWPAGHYKGIFINVYRGFDPYGLVARIPNGIRFFMKRIPALCYINMEAETLTSKWKSSTYQKFRRVFDVDFDNHDIFVSRDGIASMDLFLRNGWTKPERVNDDLFFYDEDYGQLYISVGGNDKNGFTVSYAYTNGMPGTGNGVLMDADEYINHSNLGDDERSCARKYANELNQIASVMTKEEWLSFFTEDYYKMYFEKKDKCKNDKRILDASMPREELLKSSVEDLDISVRPYNCLKRHNINTIEELVRMTVSELGSVRNMNSKSAKQILDKLHRLGLCLADERKD